MTNHDDRDFEALLRRTLQEEADRHEPAGDGLFRIRQRVAPQRRRRSVWLRPVLGLAAAAAVIAGIVALPKVVSLGRDGGNTGAPAGSQPTSPPGSASPAPTAAPSGPWGTPIAGNSQLRDRQTVWPYTSRRIGYQRADDDVRNGVHPNLRDPAATAVDFVQAFVGSDQSLHAERLDRFDPGIRMRVYRFGPGGEKVSVSNVFLVRTRIGDDAPYVVVGASQALIGDRMSISPVPRINGTAAFRVTGRVRPPEGATTTLKVELREPGSADRLGYQSIPVVGIGASQVWSVELAPFTALPSTGVVAAWTEDENGSVHEFVAAPSAP
jgi:hypothetical protein